MDVVGVDPLVIGCGISQPMYQIPSFPTYILLYLPVIEPLDYGLAHTNLVALLRNFV